MPIFRQDRPAWRSLPGVDGQRFGGGGEMPAEQGLDAGQGAAGRRDGQLLAGDLEQQRAVQVHRRQLGQPRPGVEVRPVVDEPHQHGVSMAQVGARLLQPHSTAGILAHQARSLPPTGTPVIIVMFGSDDGDLR